MNNLKVLTEITNTIENRKNALESKSYVACLFSSGQDGILKKLIEEAGEVLMASKDNKPEHITREVADLLFHIMVLLSYHDLSIENVLAELKLRQNISGLEEKNSRKS